MAAACLAELGAAAILAHPAHATTRPADCKLIVEGKIYIDGVCEFSANDKAGSFSIYGAKYWATVAVEGDRGVAHWNASPYVTHAQGELGEVLRYGGCWQNRTVSICALALDPARLDALLARRPKGLRLSPEYMDYFCVSAPSYRFVVGAPLVLDRCDSLVGVRQRVFSLANGRISFEGMPKLCVDVKSSASGEGASLVLANCSGGAKQWFYDRDTKTIHSDARLCWGFPDVDRVTGDDISRPMSARACEQDADKNHGFEFSGE